MVMAIRVLVCLLSVLLMAGPSWAALSRTTYTLQSTAGACDANGLTTGSFTPPNNSLLVVVIASQGCGTAYDYSGSVTITDSQTLTWTSRVATGDTTSWSHAVNIFTAPVGTGASMTITVDNGAEFMDAWYVHIYAYTGYDTGSPVGATASNAGPLGDGAQSITLSGSPATTSEVVAGMMGLNTGGGADGGASPNGFTEVYEGTVAQKYSQSQYRNSSTSTTVAWTDFYTGTGTFTKGGAAAIEVKAAATTRRAIPPIIY